MDIDGIISDYLGDDDNPLSKAARVNLITQVLMRDDIDQYSRSELLTSFRNAGVGIRTQDFYDLYRDVRGYEISASAIKSVPDDLIPRVETFAPNKYKQSQDYLYIVEYRYLDTDGETSYVSSFGISTNFRMSKNNILEEFENQVTEFYPQRDFLFDSQRVVKAFRRV